MQIITLFLETYINRASFHWFAGSSFLPSLQSSPTIQPSFLSSTGPSHSFSHSFRQDALQVPARLRPPGFRPRHLYSSARPAVAQPFELRGTGAPERATPRCVAFAGCEDDQRGAHGRGYAAPPASQEGKSYLYVDHFFPSVLFWLFFED